jgi:hypothetical protein
METSVAAESARSKVLPVPRVRLPPGNVPPAVPPAVPPLAESLRFNFDGLFPAKPPRFSFNGQTPAAKDGPQPKVDPEECKQQ